MSILDMLSQIVEKQIKFQEFLEVKLPVLTRDIRSKENFNNLMYQLLAMFDEVAEALRCIPWKPWKKKQMFHIGSFKEELMDIFHFLINCCIYVGMSSEDIFDEFMRKNKINWERQQSGY